MCRILFSFEECCPNLVGIEHEKHFEVYTNFDFVLQLYHVKRPFTPEETFSQSSLSPINSSMGHVQFFYAPLQKKACNLIILIFQGSKIL